MQVLATLVAAPYHLNEKVPLIKFLSERLTQEIYHHKYAHPSLEDVLNFIYDIEDGKQNAFASTLHQAWRSDDATLGFIVRKEMKRCFREVAEIEAFEVMEEYQDKIAGGQTNANNAASSNNKHEAVRHCC